MRKTLYTRISTSPNPQDVVNNSRSAAPNRFTGQSAGLTKATGKTRLSSKFGRGAGKFRSSAGFAAPAASVRCERLEMRLIPDFDAWRFRTLQFAPDKTDDWEGNNVRAGNGGGSWRK